MRFKGLDLNLLVALDALLIEKNITRAGERIHLSQSGMSSAVARLREYFDDEILLSTGRELCPTPLAESLSVPVRKILMELETTIVNRPDFNPETDQRRYRIMMSELIMLVLFPQVVKRATDEAPNVKFDLISMTENPFIQLDHGDVDLLCIPEKFSDDTHPTRELFQEDYVCVIWSGNHAIADSITLEQYQNAGHITVHFGQNQASAFDAWYIENYGMTRKAEISTSNIMVPPLFVIGTERIATVHRRIASQLINIFPLRVIEAPMNIPKLPLILQFHQQRSLDPGLKWLSSLFVEEAAKI